MASNPPPFQVEDQTDEDFFDKLVDDDFGPEKSGQKLSEGNDSDDAKAFANLSIGDVGSAFEDSGGEVGFEEKSAKGFVDVAAEDTNALVAWNTVALDSLIESHNDEKGSELRSDSMVDMSNGSGGPGVKEVEWSSFHADSAQNGGHGFGSYSDFFSELANDSSGFPAKVAENLITEEHKDDSLNNLVYDAQNQDVQAYGASVEQSTNGMDMNSSEYWENLYPGWKFDSNTGQWYQVENYNAAVSVQGSSGAVSAGDWAAVSDVKTEISYLQQTAHSVAGTVTETSTSESVSNWNQPAQENNGYPEHMYFDPQYPGWYYDTIAQEWRSLDTYTSSAQSMVHDHSQQHQNGLLSSSIYSQNDYSLYGDYTQGEKYGAQGLGNQGQDSSWAGSYSINNQQSLNMWQADVTANSRAVTSFGGNQQFDNSYGSMSADKDQQKFNSFGSVPSYNKGSQGHDANGTVGLQSFNPGNFSQPFNQANMKLNEQMQYSNDYYGSQKPVNSQQTFQNGNQFSYAPSVERSSAGRPSHALVTFGFGGKLVVMKDNSTIRNSSYGSQDPVAGSVSVLNLMEVFTGNPDVSSNGVGTCDYFRALCQQSFPGPLVGGNVGSKDLHKWIDERIADNGSPNVDSRKGEVLKLLHSLLKIACQHYGKLRSPFGSDTALRENETPESAVAKLFTFAKKNGAQFSEYGALSHCLQQLPSEGQIRATASEVQNLLVSGRKKEALLCAQEGQLWGPALVLASQLGEQFYVDTVKQMALRQLVAGSPLRTLCLLIAGQPAEVFSSDTMVDSNLPGAVKMPQQSAQFGANGMLDDWEENLAVITANRTKDDELVIIHLGDCLWKERSEIAAAHICYLVAEANFESYSDSARLCLIGSDHWKFPRTYASPEAIQRTELYEYSKVLGNSQYILLPFQPYKLIYAHMLAEVGKVSDSLKYCQAVLKSLKTGRAPEVETWKQLVLSLEERIRTHQQGGYATNLAPAKLVGKLLNFFDSTAHRVVGGLPPPAPSTSHGGGHGTEHFHPSMAPRVSTSQSTMAMSSLMPSASMEPISDWAADGNRMTMPNRSVSEPDFGRSPRQVDSSKEMTSPDAQGKASVSGGSSRFPRFGFGSQLLQKTMGLVLRPRPGKQAKLGEKNKFYYDEKLKRWVEEGVEPPAEEAALPPPPTAISQNGTSDYNLKSAMKKDGSPSNGSPDFKNSTPSEHTSGIPPIPPSSNQFSARGRMGVRSRYVDTFNQGGGSPANLFQSPSISSVKPAVAANAKFFIPTPASGEQTMEAIAESLQEGVASNSDASTSAMNDSFQSPSSSSSPMQRFPSMGHIPSKGVVTNGRGTFPSHSRRAASWSGSFSDSISPPKTSEIKPLGEALGMSPPSFMPNGPPSMRTPMNGGNFGDDLQEVEL
ncbi:hypothetical protein FNV43_RR09042 [Rhamnella rubrinervis]|uniref:Protein transport protein sec16 n=1 Tax=Rhamnella rubrinervis TaxID=2594499 RepID=A0A8K0H9Y1_9ROSA|nr:hypothetical protein FNV43_RR09042 [Rhamnella rubrinervis]